MKDFIKWEEIDFGNKISGEVKTLCPVCSHTRKTKNRKVKCLSVNMEKGLGKCFNCEGVTYRESDSIEKDQNFTLPVQDWKNYTKLSDGLVKWLESRKINQHTAIKLGWTMEKKFQPQLNKEVNNLVFNAFEKNVVVNKKYRTGKTKCFTQDAGGKSIFYNINAAIGQKEIYIVEGQMDVAAFYEIGIENVISLPNGAQDNDDVWVNSKKYLDTVEKYYIAVDNDPPGELVSEKISHRIGKWRCEKIVYKNKDANDDLIEGKEVLLKSINSSKAYPVLGTFTSQDLYDEVMDIYSKGLPPTLYPKHRCFGNLKNIFTVMKGHLVVPTGIPSHGKSNFTEWYILNLIKDYGMKATFFSPEHTPMALHKTTFIEKTFGKNFHKEFPNTPRISKDEIKRYTEWAKDKIYLTSPDAGSYATWDWLIDKFHEARFSFGTEIFVIDAFNKVEFNNEGNVLRDIKKVLGRLTDFAMRNNCIVFLVAHPTKMDKNDKGVYKIPTLYDVSGSSDFRNMTHDGFCIYRTFGTDENGGEEYTTFVNLKTKMNFQGKIGEKVEFEYHLPSGRYYPRGEYAPTHSLIDDEPEKSKSFPVINPDNDIWGDHKIDEVPF